MTDDPKALSDYLDVLDARTLFLRSYFYEGSGWFASEQAAEDLFDILVREGALRPSWVRLKAAKHRHEQELESVPEAEAGQ